MGQGSIAIEREQDRKRKGPERFLTEREQYLTAKEERRSERRDDRRAKNTAARLASDAWDAGEVDA